MQTVMISNQSDIFIPRQGNDDDLFERLLEFVEKYNKDWKRKIKPASTNMILKLFQVSQVERLQNELPKSYKIFLEKMGDDDGGLLSEILLGQVDIKNIIGLYEDYHQYEPDFFKTSIFSFCSQETGVELAFDLSTELSQDIWLSEGAKVYEKVTDNFEKLLFQCAFRRFVCYKTELCYGGSENDLKYAINRNNISDLFIAIKEVAIEYEIQKVWFSDFRCFVGMGKNIAFFIDNFNGILGRIMGDDYEEVNRLFTRIQNITGVRVLGINMD